MKILVLNGSPKGNSSTTVHTALYLEALHKEHEFKFLNVGQKIRKYEKDFSEVESALQNADLILFSYPVYTFLAPYQLHRLIELIKEHNVNLKGKFASQITTSKHFYDVTAHKFIEENCFDLGLNVIRGLSADMDDLLTAKGQEQARMFFDELIFSCEHSLFVTAPALAPKREKSVYQKSLAQEKKTKDKDIVIITNCGEDDENLKNMIADFKAVLPFESRVLNIRDFPFSGGCLGCFNCAVDGKCIYKDGFDTFLRENIQKADAFIYAFTIENHFTHSSFKCYDDRQFCNGHRTVTRGTPVGYIISGDYRYETNLRTIVESRSEVGGNYLCCVATDEADTAKELKALADNLCFALSSKITRPANFYGVGGMKIFRDLIYVMQGLMKADHRFYKENGIYDFPQKQKKRIFEMKCVGAMMAVPQIKKKMRGRMSDFIIMPYRAVVQKAKNKK